MSAIEFTTAQEIIDYTNKKWDAARDLRDKVLALLEVNHLSEAKVFYSYGYDGIQAGVADPYRFHENERIRDEVYVVLDTLGEEADAAKSTYCAGYLQIVRAFEDEMYDLGEGLDSKNTSFQTAPKELIEVTSPMKNKKEK